MTTAGEAASLFGVSDTASDPFSSALGSDSPLDDLIGDASSSNAVSDLFGSSADVFIHGAGPSSASYADAQQTWYDSTSQQTYGYDSIGTNGHAQAYQTQSSYAQPNDGVYQQYDQYGHDQSRAYSRPDAPSSNASTYEPTHVQHQSYAPQSYAPYSPSASTYAPANTAHQAPIMQHGTSSASSYDPYKPVQSQTSYQTPSHVVNATAPAPAPASSSYDPYKPYNPGPVPQQTHMYGAEPQTLAYTSPPVAVPPPPAPLISAPPPPSPSLTQFRPKTSNAYDPPLPPIKARHATVPPPRQVYNTPPPVSPPPRTTLTSQSVPPPPKGARRTPDPHLLAASVRRDSHSTTLNAPQHPPSASYVPVVNGDTANAAYRPVPGPPANHGYASMPNMTGSKAPAHTRGTHPVEGLPQVNATYAPPYVPGLPHQSGFDHNFSEDAENGRSTSNHVAHHVASPLHEAIPEADEEAGGGEETPQISQDTSTQNSVASAITRSPPMSADLPATPVYAWPDDDPPHMRGPPYPDKTLSPPRPSGAASPSLSSQAQTVAYNSYAPPSKSDALDRAKSPYASSIRSLPSASTSRGQAPSATYDPYAPPSKSATSDRAKSPGASSVRSLTSASRQSYEQPPRRDSVTTSPPLGRPPSSQSRRSTLSNSYEPHPITDPKRATSPTGSIRSIPEKQSAYDLHMPAGTSAVHARTTSNGSAYSGASVTDPYAPPVRPHPARQNGEFTYGSFTLPPTMSHAPSAPVAPSYDRSGAQVVTLVAPVHSVYAPSPSLLGTNDPLGRTAARVPVISFGFGGKLVTCFHGADMNTGFDVALSARQSTDITIQSLQKMIPESALDTSTASYPGPLFSDPGSPNASLVRTGAQVLKAKKARVLKYLEERAEEMKGGLGYHRSGTVDRGRAEAKRALVMLLKVMVEYDGRLSGSPQIDSAIREALASHGAVSLSSSESKTAAGVIPATSTEHLSSSYSTLGSVLPHSQDRVVTNTVVRSSQLDKIQDLLARGDRRGACHYAADEKLWSHALLIASSVDKECWKEVVTEWIRAELVTSGAQGHGDVSNGRESLRVAYSVFGGSGAAAVQELVHPNSLLHHGQTNLQVPQQPQAAITPMTPNFPVIQPQSQPLNISQEVLADWAKTASMILSNPTTPESSAALTALGDQLSVHHWAEAAHVCYLLSPQTSPLGGIGSNPRLMLLGSPPPSASPIFYKDPDPIVFSEIAEFAMSLATPAKGQEPFAGLPHLQPYRLIRALYLAEIGDVQLASRYCDAITGCIGRGSPYLNVAFLEQLRGLSDRLIAVPHLDKTGSWIGGKVSKPSLDSIGNWLEGRFTKFIAGEGESPRPEEAKQMAQQQSHNGPFANFSSISSTTNSAYPSPHQSVTDLTEFPSAGLSAPPLRAGSTRPPSRSRVLINRASSAMDHVRPFQRAGSPIARVASASAATYADAASYGQARGPYGNGYTPVPAHGFDNVAPDSSSHADVSALSLSKAASPGSWWGASESDVGTPTASTFVPPDDHLASSTLNSGFISLMDDPMLCITPSASKPPDSSLARSSQQTFDDDDDDLGLGNSSKKNTPKPDNGEPSEAAPVQEQERPKMPAADKNDLKQTSSSGWLSLSRIWGKRETTPAPVKANLGEQSSFYYDKELKRWVNKSGGGESATPTPAPPPPRAQTASPGRQLGTGPPPSPLGAPPPARPATAQAIDLSSQPPRRPPARIRSNLVPSDADGGLSVPSSPLPPPPGTPPPPGNGPPAGRARGGAAKRNVRNRYVDVFQQEGGTPS